MDSRWDVGDTQSGSSAGSGGKAVGDELCMETEGNRVIVGGVTADIRSVCWGEGIWGGADVGGRLGGSKRPQRSNFGPPWKEYHGKLRLKGYRNRESQSRI